VTKYKYHKDGSEKRDASGYYAMVEDLAKEKVWRTLHDHLEANEKVYRDKEGNLLLSHDELLADMATARVRAGRTYDFPNRGGRPQRRRPPHKIQNLYFEPRRSPRHLKTPHPMAGVKRK
jgi:hypothetical protein